MNRIHQRVIIFLVLVLLPTLCRAEYEVKVVYFKAREAEDIDREKYEKIFRQIQNFIRDEMSRHGYGEKTIKYENDSKGFVKIHTVEGRHSGEHYSGGIASSFLNKVSTEIPFEINGVTNLVERENHYIVILAGVPLEDGSGKIGSSVVYPGFNGGIGVVNANHRITKPKGHAHLIAHELGHTFGALLKHTTDSEEMMGPIGFDFPRYISENNAEALNGHPSLSVVPSETLTIRDVPYTTLTFTNEDVNTITPTNRRNEWDGWLSNLGLVGIWEKYIDGTISNKPVYYYNFSKMDAWSHWMYSHAPSKIVYDVSDKEYTSFSSYFSVPAVPALTCEPSMELVVSADDREIYRMKLDAEKSGTLVEFDIPSGAKTLVIDVDELGNKGCDHFVIGEPKLYYAEKSNSPLEEIDADVNDDGYVDLYDVMIVKSGMNRDVSYDTDINDDGKTDEVDLLIVKAKAVEAIIAAAPRKRKIKLTTWGAMKTR